MSVDLLYADETYKIRGAIFAVYRQLGLKFGLIVNFHDIAPKTRVVRADR